MYSTILSSYILSIHLVDVIWEHLHVFLLLLLFFRKFFAKKPNFCDFLMAALVIVTITKGFTSNLQRKEFSEKISVSLWDYPHCDGKRK